MLCSPTRIARSDIFPSLFGHPRIVSSSGAERQIATIQLSRRHGKSMVHGGVRRGSVTDALEFTSPPLIRQLFFDQTVFLFEGKRHAPRAIRPPYYANASKINSGHVFPSNAPTFFTEFPRLHGELKLSEKIGTGFSRTEYNIRDLGRLGGILFHLIR